MSTPFYDLASLVLVPSGYKTSKVYAQKPLTTDGQLAFTRASTATRVNSAGLIEKVRTNYIATQNFSLWSKLTGTDVVTSGVVDPFGGTNAYNLSGITAGNYSSGLTIGVTIPVGANSYFTTSVYMKGSGTIALTAQGTGFFSPLPITLTSTWTRYNITISPSSAISTTTLYISNFTGSTATSVDLAFTQVELGDIATDYIATTTAAVSVGPVANVPRLDYLNSSCPRLLLEPQRTNSITFSENIGSTNWDFYFGTQVANTTETLDPSGYYGAEKVIMGTGNQAVYRQSIGGLTNGGTYTLSLYIKQGSGVTAFLDISDTSSTVDITPTGEWVRYTKTGVWNTSANYIDLEFRGTSGSAYCYIWGAQLEAGAYATSYIPTLGSASTRGSDAASKTSASALIGQTEGVLFIDIVTRNNIASVNRVISITESNWLIGGSIRIDLQSTSISVDIVDNSGSVGAVGGNIAVTANTRYKIALAYKQNQLALYVNGTQLGTSTSTGVMPTCSQLYLNELGGGFGGPYEATAFNQAILFPTRLSNSDLAALTA